jgi:glycosyltransferase involved in cell wall biosynthesis
MLENRSAPGISEAVQLTVVTPTPAGTMRDNALPFRIHRHPRLLKLLKLIWQTDILHLAGTDMLPLLLGWLLRKRMVVEHHGFQTICPNGQLIHEPTQSACPGHYMAGRYTQCLRCNAAQGRVRSLKQSLFTFPRRWLCSRARANVVPTAWLGTLLQLRRMVTIHHGLRGGRTVPSHPAKPQTVVFMGRLVSTKGVHTLLQATDQLSDCEFKLVIIGEGPERKKLEAEAQRLQLADRVVFRGYLNPDQLEEELAGTKVIVMPSLAGEVFGLVALENMLREKTLVVSKIGSLIEVVGDAGLSFPAGDATSLAECMRKVLQSHAFADSLGTRAKQRAATMFTPEKMVADHLALYRSL